MRQERAEVIVSSLPRFQPATRKLLASTWPEANQAPGNAIQSLRSLFTQTSHTHAYTQPSTTEKYSYTCDIDDDQSIKLLFEQVTERYHGHLDVLVHAIAYASPTAMKNLFLDTTREDFAQAHVTSSYSLVALAREAVPLMKKRKEGSVAAEEGSASIISLSYLGANRVCPMIKTVSHVFPRKP